MNIEDDHFYAAENLTDDDILKSLTEIQHSKKRDKRLLAFDIENLLVAIENKK